MNRPGRASAVAAGAMIAGLVAAASVAGTRPAPLPRPVRGITIAAAVCPPGYDRATQFGSEPTARTRAEVIRTNLRPDGTVIDAWTREPVDPKLTQIDHVRSLRSAWCHGAAAWTPEFRLAFARDAGNLVPTIARVNESKSDQDPATWQPPAAAARCDYGLRWVSMTRTFHLSATRADLLAAAADIASCP